MDSVHVPCPKCLGVNRVKRARMADHPTCGRCKAESLPDHPIALDDASFQRYIAASELPVVVDFWASWCGPCRTMAPQFEAAARANVGVRFVKVDTDAARATAARYGIQSIPTMIAFRNGRELARQSGVMGQRQILSWLSHQLGGSHAA